MRNRNNIPDQDITPIVIRPIEEKDNEGLAKLIRMVFEEFEAPRCESVYSDPTTDRLYQYFNRPNAKYWVAVWKDTIVGGCGFYPTHGLPDGCCEVVKFYLSSSIRGKGVGSQLLLLTEEQAKEAGYKQLYIETFPCFRAAVHLYDKMGFKYLDARLGNSGHTATTIHMIKDI